MTNNNELILIISAILLATLVGVSIFFLSRILSTQRRATKNKLESFKDKFTGNKDRADISKRRAIRALEKETGLAKLAESFIPRPAELKIRLARTGKDFDVSKYAILNGLIALFVSAGLLAWTGNLMISIMGGITLGLMIPHVAVNRMIRKRQQEFIKLFPEALDLIVRGLKSGLPVNEAIINVGEEVTAPVGTEFRRISDDIKLGKTLEDAMWDASERIEVPDFKFFIISLSVQRETGGNLGETLENLSRILRQRQQMKLKIRAMSSEAKASAWIVGLLPFIMLGLIMMLNYDYGIILFTHPKAIVAGIGAMVWMSIGVFVMKKMINFEA